MRIPNGWLYHLAPEIIQQLSPSTDEDKLPFSKQSDVFAFGLVQCIHSLDVECGVPFEKLINYTKHYIETQG